MAFVLTFLIRRLAQGVIIVLLVTFLIFTLLRVIPGDPVRIMLGPSTTEAVVEARAKELGLRDSIPEQFVRYIADAVRGDFGKSYFIGETGIALTVQNVTGGKGQAEATEQPEAKMTRAGVLKVIGDGLPYTLLLAGMGLLFTMIVAIPLGIAAGLNSEKWQDRLAFFVGSLFISLPNFWLALVLILLITARLGWLPSIGYKGFSYVILPAVVLAVELAPIIIRGLSMSIAQSLQSGYVSSGVVRGLPWRQIIVKHVLRNSSIPMLNLFGVQIGGLLLGGVFVAEFVFDYPGIGRTTVQAVLQRDFPVIQGVAILAAGVLVIANILVDLASTFIDRRLKF
jgi:peptide/nickel transport system permease protein